MRIVLHRLQEEAIVLNDKEEDDRLVELRARCRVVAVLPPPVRGTVRRDVNDTVAIIHPDRARKRQPGKCFPVVSVADPALRHLVKGVTLAQQDVVSHLIDTVRVRRLLLWSQLQRRRRYPQNSVDYYYLAWFNTPHHYRWHAVATHTREPASRSVPRSTCALADTFAILTS